MTNQPTNNEDRIRKAHLQFRDNWRWNQTGDDFRKAIEDNLPQSISREAVEKLREKREEKRLQVEARDSSQIQAITLIVINEFYKDLDALLFNPQDDTN